MNKDPSDQPAPEPDRWQAIARYIAGESPPEETAEVRRWLEVDPRRAELVAGLEQVLERLAAHQANDVDVESALQRVKARMGEDPVLEPRPSRRLEFQEQFSWRWRRTVTRVAAVFVVVLGVSLIWRASQKPQPTVSVAAAQTFTTGVGETDSLRLADGTQVILAPGSRLTVAEGYGSRARVVELDGEAFFDVEHDAGRPFSVRAGGATIRDLGTAFVVRNTSTEAVRVAVTEGSVVLHPYMGQEREGVVLRAGDRGVLDREGNVSAERGAVNAEDIAFTSGRLVFEDASLEEVSAQLERWYGVELRVLDNRLTSRHITAAFEGESVEEVLNVIQLALGARIERNGDTAFVRSSR